MAKSNKFEQEQFNQLSEGRGIFSAFWKKLTSSRLKNQLKKMEKDPQMRDSIKLLDKSIEDLERALEASAALDNKTDKGDRDASSKDRIKLYKDLGLL
tara:strand:+ start:38 stop:331 length:294 start_codon:yes stop_codon:yes gene_type:complete